MILTIFLLAITLCLILGYICILKSRCNYFKQRGLPGPSPVLFFGHYRILWSLPNLSEQLRQWTQQYGSIYGLLEGTRPMYVVSDVNFLQEVFIKQFASFNTRSIPFLMKKVKGHQVHMFGASGSTWHRQRHIINPTFSTAKLKLMPSSIHDCIQSLMNKLKNLDEKGEEFNIYEMYRRLTMDVICRCAFGINMDMQNDVNNILMRKCKLAIDDNPERLFLTKLGNLLPFLIPILHYVMIGQMLLGAFSRAIGSMWFLPKIEELPALWILNQIGSIINTRRQVKCDDKLRQVDLLQLMLNATISDDIKITDDLNDKSIASKQLHKEEVIANMLLFMIAGYDSVSTVLASCTYVLATKNDIQEKLRAEIDEQEWNDDNQLSYDIIMNMSYMDIFLREVLRMYPIAIAATKRECNMTTIVNGHKIEKGVVIQPDVLSIHYDRNLWGPEDPNLFIPERHLTKRHPMAHMAFGAGPRGCVGIRFAFMELKLCLSQLLRHYKILPGDNIEQGFKHQETFLIQPNAVYIKLEKR
ncbi:unnamed protein product [Adineta steineri]|uniref:Cytochrome P450 n=1 Tax=Adineta steineri TaxID=433720 RepID=A0A815KAK9_9BILA|nr:unnamed protein product [Adineta steineri]CAF1611889.1 unnamed protein product [Adineta steineri]